MENVVNILDECYYGDRKVFGIPITSSDYGNNKKSARCANTMPVSTIDVSLQGDRLSNYQIS
ncbi:hypothetical protein [Brevibacillus brevis]|uniref:hypothetical protein n=1 Tax=Brevibacillus brevis TaxID=1393 RepID=UPI0037CCC283